jgi:hypothetical protein
VLGKEGTNTIFLNRWPMMTKNNTIINKTTTTKEEKKASLPHPFFHKIGLRT